MSQYRYLLANLVTGLVYSELELTNVSAERGLLPGGFSADLPLAHLPLTLRKRYIDETQPGKFTVLVLRDGECLGEWIVWKRVRTNTVAPVQLSGQEFVSYLDHRLVTRLNQTPVTDVEQFKKEYQAFRKAKPREAVVLEAIRQGNDEIIRIEPPQ